MTANPKFRPTGRFPNTKSADIAGEFFELLSPESDRGAFHEELGSSPF